MSAIAGFGAFIAILFVIGSLMEHDRRKLAISLIVFVALGILAMRGQAPTGVSAGTCVKEWDGFSNSEACD